MKKSILLAIIAVVSIGLFPSCSKTCVCTATLNGQTIDQVEYEDLSGSECEAKVDETTQHIMDTYDPASIIGIRISCSHL